MPLKPGSSKSVVSSNISEFHGGKTYSATEKKFGKAKADKQAVAVALSNARKYAGGGFTAPKTPWVQRMGARGMTHTNAPKMTMLNSSVPGRTDKLALKVPSGSYVLPADIVSSMGEGNSAAGAKQIQKMLHSGAMKAAKPGIGKLKALPFKMKFGRASGGAAPHVPIMAAGGEVILHPEAVEEIGHGNMKHGHDHLDKWVVEQRKKSIKTLRKLKPPVKT